MRKRKFGLGGDVEGGVDERMGGETEQGSEEPTPKTAEPERTKSFKEAFAEARSNGSKIFTWNGKKFTTEVATEKPKSRGTPPSAESQLPAPRSDRLTRIGAAEPAQYRSSRLVPEDQLRKIMPNKFAKGGSVRGWGQARGARKAKIV